MKLSESMELRPKRGLVYGMSGAGKPILIARMAMFDEFCPLYVFDWDLRIESVRAIIPKDRWSLIDSDPYRDMSMQGEAFLKMQAKAETIVSQGFKTAFLDSGTFMMKGIMNRVLMLDGKPATDTPQLQHYMKAMSLTEDIVSRLCAKPLNF